MLGYLILIRLTLYRFRTLTLACSVLARTVKRRHDGQGRCFRSPEMGGRQVRKLQVSGLVFACFGPQESWCFLHVSRMFLAPRNGFGVSVRGKFWGNGLETADIVPKRCVSHLFPTRFRRISLSRTPLRLFLVSRYVNFPHVSWLPPFVSQPPKQPNNSPETRNFRTSFHTVSRLPKHLPCLSC